MIRIVLGVILALHGLVHLWFVVLAMRWVEYRPDMGWTGQSWLLTPTLGDEAARSVATALLAIAAAAFVVGGGAVVVQAPWWRLALIIAAVVSSVVLIVAWDGSTDMLVQKGLIGVAINVLVLIVATW